MDQIAVSVIVPIYNVVPWLAECLDSLERQTLKNMEVILVNDGSTDGSDQIAKEYAQRNECFKYIERTNGGLSAARNTGIAKANGKYIYFLDSDDYLVDDALEKLYRRAEEKDLDIILFSSYVFEDGSKEMTWDNAGFRYKGEYYGTQSGQNLQKQFFGNRDIFPSCCMIFTKLEVITSNSLLFEENIIHEDNLFHFQVLSLSQRAEVMNSPLYCRRIRSGSITQVVDYMKRSRSMYISSVRADEFIEAHPNLERMICINQMGYFASMQMVYWSDMSEELRRSEEFKTYIKATKRIVKKYDYGKKKSIFLFYKCKFVYKVMYGIRRHIS